MVWWKKKKTRVNDKNQRFILERERGAWLLQDLIECCDGKSNPIKFFSELEILYATCWFGKSYKILSALSSWYSGEDLNDHMLLIQRLGNQLPQRFCRDIAISSMVSGHKNFLKLVGCCIEFKDPVMVYHGVKKHYQLDIRKQSWIRRMKMAEDIATALAYLHNAFPRPFIYMNMCLDNILLDEDGVAKLTSFSRCISIPQGETFVKVDKVEGEYDYMERDYLKNGVVSEKTDVFAIGIFMQSLLTGEETYLEMFRFMEIGRIEEIADPNMLKEMDEISEEEFCRMRSFLMLSLRCVGVRGEVPMMVEVAKELKKIQRSL